MNKLRSFLLRPDLQAVLGPTEPRFELSEIFGATATPGRALLVRLPRGELGAEAATLLGSLVVHQVWQASQTRAGMRSGRRSPVFVYLDEFQDVLRLPLALGEALVQARGLGVGLVLAHQHLGQLSPAVKGGSAGQRRQSGGVWAGSRRRGGHEQAIWWDADAERLHWSARL
jgi:hypothetical protein